MAKKPTVVTAATGYQSTDVINSNFTNLRDAFDNTLSLDGSTPNAMNADLDLNGFDILNVGNISGLFDDKLFIVASGQSNAMGSNANSTGGDQTVNAKVKAWNGSAWVTATLGVAPFSTGSPTKNNVNFQFAKAVQENFGGTVYLVLSGQGSTSIREWLTTNTSYVQWTNLNNAVAAALATTELSGKTGADVFTWFQGENNFAEPIQNTAETETLYDTYTEAFLRLRTQAITAGWLEETTPVIAGSIASNYNVSKKRLIDLDRNPHYNWFGLASNLDCPLTADGIHYTGTGYEIMGKRHWLGTWKSLPKSSVAPLIITPRQYGAVGDGVTDDTAAVQTALNAVGDIVGSNTTDGANAELNLEGLCYLISSELVVSTATNNGFRITNGKLLAKSSSGVWSPDANGFSTKALLKVTQFVAKGTIENVTFDCQHVTNGITRSDSAGGFWKIRQNDIINFNRWGLYLGSGSGDSRIELNAITEKSPVTYPAIPFVGNITNGSTTISSISSTTTLTVGKSVEGIGIPFDTRIVSKTSTSVTLSQAATATSTGRTFAATDYHGFGIWHNNADDKITSNTVRWCLCPLLMDAGASTGLILNNHFYNGASGAETIRRESRIIHIKSGSNSNVFTGNYFDNGMIEIRGFDQTFYGNRIAYTGTAENQAIFLLVATSSNQTISSNFSAVNFELPNDIQAETSGSPPLFKLGADSGASWNGLTNSLIKSNNNKNALYGSTNQEINARPGDTVVKRLISTDTSARIDFKDADTTEDSEPFVGSTGDNITFGNGSIETARLTPEGNFGINTTVFGTNAEGVLALENGTAPTTGPANTVQIFSTDLSAGNTILSLRTEGTPVSSNTSASPTKRIAIRINGTVYYLLAAETA